jgi:ferric-dicitrate binding protein FerR (iron transport regulator)
MTRLCRDVTTSLGRPLSTLSEAERLHLEQHLSECDECRHQSALSRAVTELVFAAPSQLSESARERAIAGAFERATRSVPGSPGVHWARRVSLALAAAAVVLLGLRLLLVDPKGGEVIVSAPRAPTTEPTVSALARNVSEHVDDDGAESTEQTWIESKGAETRTFGGARVTLAAGTRVRIVRGTNTLELARGQATLDVEHQHERPFAVLTQAFRAEVLGTQFVVSPEHVEVLRGHVQVRERESDALISDLLTGQSYRRDAPLATAATSAPVSEPARATESATPRGTRRMRHPARETARSADAEASRAADKDVDTARAGVAGADDAGELIRKTRAALAAGDVTTARKLVERAGRAAQRVTEQAEVATLLAECELLARRPEAAIRAYLGVAERFSGLHAGENALFAAAQLSLRQRDESAARALFERYLTRYPTGRFSDEARAHLSPPR